MPEPVGPAPTPPPGLRSRATLAARRVEHAAVALREWSQRHVRPLTIVALVVFAGLCGLAARQYAGLHLHPDLWLLLPAALGGALVMATLNAAEYACGAVVARHHPTARESITVSIAGSAVNMLPVPGAFLVRNYAMVSGGATFAGAMVGSAVTGAAWMGITATVVGTIVATADPALGVPVAVVGLTIFVAVAVATYRRLDRHDARRVVGGLILVEVLTVWADVGRYWLVLAALGAHPTLMRTIPLVSANALSAASIIFPGGLGVREALAGGFSAAANLPAAVGIAASAVDRVALTIPFVALAAGVAALRRTGRDRPVTGVTVPSEGRT